MHGLQTGEPDHAGSLLLCRRFPRVACRKSERGAKVEYVSLYRRWRPQRFAEVVGQRHVVLTLQRAITQGRVGHAYLFAGPRGTGKTTVARILSKALNCRQGPSPEPCLACDICQAIAAGSCLDVIEMDAASNRGVDEVRHLRENVGLAPAQGRTRVYIIDEVHMLTTEAFNALLKTLEEPPPHVLFVLATTEPHRLPLTITSRCQRFEFRRLDTRDMVARLKEYGLITSCHCHGKLSRALHCIRDIGFDGTDPVEPPPAGDLTYAQAREVAGGKVTLIGNIEWSELCFAEPAHIRRRVREVLSLGKERLILSTSAGPIGPITPRIAENYRAFVETALEFGS